MTSFTTHFSLKKLLLLLKLVYLNYIQCKLSYDGQRPRSRKYYIKKRNSRKFSIIFIIEFGHHVSIFLNFYVFIYIFIFILLFIIIFIFYIILMCFFIFIFLSFFVYIVIYIFYFICIFIFFLCHSHNIYFYCIFTLFFILI